MKRSTELKTTRGTAGDHPRGAAAPTRLRSGLKAGFVDDEPPMGCGGDGRGGAVSVVDQQMERW
jgi:hypothetical protein